MTKLKLTDADRVILSSAGARENSLVLPVPKSLKKSKATRDDILRDLLDKGLISERQSELGEDNWTSHDNGERTTLVITVEGLAAVGMEPDAGEAVDKAHKVPSRRKEKTDAKPASRPTRPAKNPTPASQATPKTPKAVGAGKLPTKLDMVISALRQKKGSTIAELMEVTGWQAHSIRGAISGALKKRMGLEIGSKPVEGRGRVYRVEG